MKYRKIVADDLICKAEIELGVENKHMNTQMGRGSQKNQETRIGIYIYIYIAIYKMDN